LATIPDAEFEDFKKRGIDWIYLLGVWQLGPYGLNFDRRNGVDPYLSTLPDCKIDDIIGSVFAVTNYTVNSEVGSMNELAYLRKKLNQMGLKLMLDFVPNHSALDSYLMKGDLSYYIRAPAGVVDKNKYYTNGVAYGSAAYCAPWMDVAQFNYFEVKTRKLMTSYLETIASFADGIRCDMAHIVLNSAFASQWSTELKAYGYKTPSSEFWEDAIIAAKKINPNLIVIGEVYGEDNMKTLQSLGFDYTYDKELYDRLINGNLDNIRGYINGNSPEFMQKNAHFLENHDDNRGITAFGSFERADAAAAVLFTLPGMKFSFQGQWVGKTWKLDVHLRRSYDEPANQEVIDFYNKLIPIVGAEPFKNGAFEMLTATNDASSWRILAWKWAYKNEKRLVAVNYSDQYGSGAVKLSDCSGNGNINVNELFSNATYVRSAEELRKSGLFVVLKPWQAQIFSYP
jgi:glycosidase